MLRFLFIFILLTTVDMQLIGQDLPEEDWANLNKYQEQNTALKTSGKTVDVVLMGNSITESWVAMRPIFFRKNGYVGRGISGQTSAQMLVRFRQDVIDLHPKVVVILSGTNDIAGNTGPTTNDQIIDNISSMANLAEYHGLQIILCAVLPASDYSWAPGMQPHIRIPALNEQLKALANKNRYYFLDFFAAMDDEEAGLLSELTYDGVHPNKAGYKVMEPLLVDMIEVVLDH
jgi:lysophospholipase L1-like esterase